MADFIAILQANGFTHVSFDMANGVTITGWRKSERKTYNVYMAASLEEAQAKFLALLTPKTEPDFDDI